MKAVVANHVVAESEDMVEARGYQYFPPAAVRMEWLDASLPNDFLRASACVNEGRTLHETAPRSALGTALGDLTAHAHTWCKRSAPARRTRRGLLDRLRGK